MHGNCCYNIKFRRERPLKFFFASYELTIKRYSTLKNNCRQSTRIPNALGSGTTSFRVLRRAQIRHVTGHANRRISVAALVTGRHVTRIKRGHYTTVQLSTDGSPFVERFATFYSTRERKCTISFTLICRILRAARFVRGESRYMPARTNRNLL